eukprot:9253394-Alexandrium_andersonii.AAC.1
MQEKSKKAHARALAAGRRCVRGSALRREALILDYFAATRARAPTAQGAAAHLLSDSELDSFFS